jgi:hypothetical protein
MSSTARTALTALIALVPVVIVAAVLYRGHARRMAEQEAALEAARRELASLADVRARVEEFQRKKKEYEERIRLIETWRSQPGLRALEVVKLAESSGVVIDELAVTGMELKLSCRQASPDTAARLARRMEETGLTTKATVAPGDAGGFVLTATLSPLPVETPAP